ncbi:hypothetical protein CA982_18615 [Gordonia lacunae]|uniref:Uncharacterized protein n=1 Tax=Gordonia lacunae TaxID=417102 RepID=A0A2C9ZIH6_9ACTN|nr:hypothetical protein CA982_18615 [Gordonia lacunae]
MDREPLRDVPAFDLVVPAVFDWLFGPLLFAEPPREPLVAPPLVARRPPVDFPAVEPPRVEPPRAEPPREEDARVPVLAFEAIRTD